MMKQISAVPLLALTLDPQSSVSLYQQLYDGLRSAILTGRLTAGTRLPATRTLASELGISRTTVVTALEQLQTEGYLEARVGSGTYVARVLPEELLHASKTARQADRQTRAPRALSQRAQLLARTSLLTIPKPGRVCAFQAGLPALDEIPFDIWSRLAARYYRHTPRELLSYGDAAGYRPLREAIAAYLNTSRAVRCTAEQVIVVSGTQQGLEIATRLLLEPGDGVWMEEPGYTKARDILIAAGARLHPVPVDQEGLNVANGQAVCPGARLVYVSPSHQYPLGVIMSLSRRLALLEWAHQAGAWILEDDYDSEYRYRGRPLSSLQGLDTREQVIYMGTFSKVLFPALRLGYLVVPSDLVDTFIAARALLDRHSPQLEQAILADFIAEGHFVRHIRRMRTLYEHRQQVLLEVARQELAGLLEVSPHEAGMHLVGWLPPDRDDRTVSRRAALKGVDVQALSVYALCGTTRPGLLLGYTCFTDDEICEGVRRLAQALQEEKGIVENEQRAGKPGGYG
jgi:GntR family transcriptional regulator/MocR family aminotransferase